MQIESDKRHRLLKNFDCATNRFLNKLYRFSWSWPWTHYHVFSPTAEHRDRLHNVLTELLEQLSTIMLVLIVVYFHFKSNFVNVG